MTTRLFFLYVTTFMSVQSLQSVSQMHDIFTATKFNPQSKSIVEDEKHADLDLQWRWLASSRHRWYRHADHSKGVRHFFTAVDIYDWTILIIATLFFLSIHNCIRDWPSTQNFHGSALLIWLFVGILFAGLIFLRMNGEETIDWIDGYMLELIFSLENIFVFHMIFQAFETPRAQSQVALFIVVCCQLVFEMVFFMGFAHWLRSLEVLPYILGVWLLYVGYLSSQEHVYDSETQSHVIGGFKCLLGDRFTAKFDQSCKIFVEIDNKRCVTLLGTVVVCLLSVDFLLEIDVTLTKIEEIRNPYIAFSSSAVAAFMVPELYFVAHDLFNRFSLMKYGITFVLCFFGAQMLLQELIAIPSVICCLTIFAVLAACLIASLFVKSSCVVGLPPSPKVEQGAEFQSDSSMPCHVAVNGG